MKKEPLTYGELKAGLSRLLGAGLIVERNGKFYYPEKIISAFHYPPSDFGAYEKVHSFLNSHAGSISVSTTPSVILDNINETVFQKLLEEVRKRDDSILVFGKFLFYALCFISLLLIYLIIDFIF